MLAVSHCRVRSDGCDQEGLAEDLLLNMSLSIVNVTSILCTVPTAQSYVSISIKMYLNVCIM